MFIYAQVVRLGAEMCIEITRPPLLRVVSQRGRPTQSMRAGTHYRYADTMISAQREPVNRHYR